MKIYTEQLPMGYDIILDLLKAATALTKVRGNPMVSLDRGSPDISAVSARHQIKAALDLLQLRYPQAFERVCSDIIHISGNGGNYETVN